MLCRACVTAEKLLESAETVVLRAALQNGKILVVGAEGGGAPMNTHHPRGKRRTAAPYADEDFYFGE